MTHELLRHSLSPRRREAPAPQRASLDGLEVSESSFGEWLEAGGERRGEGRDDSASPSTHDA